MAGYFDSHAHYWDDRFVKETEKGADALVGSLLENGVSGIVNVGTSPATSRLAIAQAMRHPGMFAAAGLHPSDAGALENPEEALSEIEALFSHPAYKLVAVGEIGLDYHFLPFDREMQNRIFRLQLEMAERLSLPVIVHDREAHGDCFDAIREYPGVHGVFHSYSGSAEMAKDLVRRGWMISFSGTLTFKNARNVKEAAAALPRESVMIETDCPYLAPHPFRGQLNHSGLLQYTAAALAEAFGCTAEEAAQITDENARRFFGIRPAL